MKECKEEKNEGRSIEGSKKEGREGNQERKKRKRKGMMEGKQE